MSKIIVLAFCCLWILYGCSANDEDVVFLRDVNRKAIRVIEREYELVFVGKMAGGPEKIRRLGLMFESNEPLTIENARKILVGCAKEYLDIINNQPKAEQFLYHVPFEVGDIDLEVYSPIDPEGNPPYEPYIVVAAMSEGDLRYRAKTPGQKGYAWTKRESFAEAVELVCAQEARRGR